MKSAKKRRTILNVLLLGSICSLVFFGVAYIFGNYTGAFQTKMWIDNQGEINFDETVAVNFSVNMITSNNFSEHIQIFPNTDVEYIWENLNKTLKITPKKNWDIETKYKIKFDGLKNVFLVENNGELEFSTIDYPVVKSFYPKNNTKDVVIDTENPGIIIFNKSLNDFNLKIKVSPDKKLNYNINDDKSVIHFSFENGYERGQKYQITFYTKHKGENSEKFKKIYETVFQTEAPPPEEWGSDFVTRVDQAKQFTNAKIEEGKYIDINLKIQVMTIFENGDIIDSFLVSSGKRGMDTPMGSFKIANKYPRPWSKQYGLYMPNWMAFVSSGKYGIHELPEWPSGYKEGQDHLGTPVSHGCVRLGIDAAEKVYSWAEIGTPVIIY